MASWSIKYLLLTNCSEWRTEQVVAVLPRWHRMWNGTRQKGCRCSNTLVWKEVGAPPPFFFIRLQTPGAWDSLNWLRCDKTRSRKASETRGAESQSNAGVGRWLAGGHRGQFSVDGKSRCHMLSCDFCPYILVRGFTRCRCFAQRLCRRCSSALMEQPKWRTVFNFPALSSVNYKDCFQLHKEPWAMNWQQGARSQLLQSYTSVCSECISDDVPTANELRLIIKGDITPMRTQWKVQWKLSC